MQDRIVPILTVYELFLDFKKFLRLGAEDPIRMSPLGRSLLRNDRVASFQNKRVQWPYHGVFRTLGDHEIELFGLCLWVVRRPKSVPVPNNADDRLNRDSSQTIQTTAILLVLALGPLRRSIK